MHQALSIYIHYPFCKSKCPYCDFNSHVRDNVDYENFLCAYEKELEFFAAKISPRQVKSIFFGGGTPSLMPIFLVEGILKKISQLWIIADDCEITLEANPTSFEAAKFKDLQQIGINRLSLGIQALNDDDLKFLGRQHCAKEAIATIEIAAKIFDNFSFDLIYARPRQTVKSWCEELICAINFGSNHLSLYQLTIEKGTKFFSEFKQKKFQIPDENLAAQLYEKTYEITANAGLELYEISNYAKKDFQSRHNLSYWQGEDYIGIGAGAHSRIYFKNELQRSAIAMICEPLAWLKKVENFGVGIQKLEKITASDLEDELILMALRLKEGLSEKFFYQHFQKKLSEIFDFEKLKKLENQGLITTNDHQIKICDDYRLLTNEIIKKICQTKFN
ncbi:MAG: radical SAM family heme chaperone HemW [Rickettsiales bacterium]|nr:radical SAM family heme chaperone HemW [Rickettsiales bacterium]